MIITQRLFIIVGTPGSGKDLLIRAVNDMGAQHAQIVPKHTSRARRRDDGNEMICPGDPDYDLEGCDVTYENYADRYGIKSDRIWKGLRKGAFQVVVVSNIDAIKDLQRIFGELMVLIYVHSEKTAEEYRREEAKHGNGNGYVKRRTEEYGLAYRLYLENFLAFNHVLIYSGLREDLEDLYDQVFRLFRAYERGGLSYATAKPVVSGRIWTAVMPGNEPRIEPRIIE